MSSLFRPTALSARRQQSFGEVLVTTPAFGRWCAAAGGLLLCALAALVLLGSYRARVTVSGYLTSELGMLRVQAAKPARVNAILVREGQWVEASQPLLELAVESWSHGERLEDVRRQSADAQVAELSAAIARHHARERADRKRRDAALAAGRRELALLTVQADDAESRRVLAGEQYALARRAFERNLISRADFQRASLAHLEAGMARRDIQLTLERQEQAVSELAHQLTVAPLSVAQELGELSQRLAHARSQQADVRFAGASVLRAPAAGRVRGLTAQPGQWVMPGQLLATVQRPAPLVARMLLPTRAAGQVQVGQPARIRLAAFPYQKHGLIEAQVSLLSQALVEPTELPSGLSLAEPAYWVTARLTGGHAELAVRPGMVLSADLLREERRIWEWLAEPLLSLKR
ncbi:MAG: HlyD family efflux transporter periplasmic adaptor subunit [Pseudomonadota bacterium]